MLLLLLLLDYHVLRLGGQLDYLVVGRSSRRVARSELGLHVEIHVLKDSVLLVTLPGNSRWARHETNNGWRLCTGFLGEAYEIFGAELIQSSNVQNGSFEIYCVVKL